ncbi:MAG: rhomboid family intramembrane serine protease [Acidobacteria bacterium]|nr:rhomboid family intramembrane serine protease [Acidobacteriota bacterium]
MINKQRFLWKLHRLARQLEEQLDSFRNLWLGAQSNTRMCPACRALIDRGAKVCPLCGVKLRYKAGGLGKLLQNIVPNFMPLSFVLLTVNFAFFLLIFAAERDLSAQDLGRLVWGVNSPTLARWGADVGMLVEAGQWWRLVSAIFIHIGIIHLAFNSYALIFIGPLLEESLGKERFFLLYIVTGAFGFVVSNWYYDPRLATAGASGAIFGLIAAAIVFSRRWSAWGSMLGQQLVHWAIYGFGYGLVIGANNAAHFGGFVAGAAFAFLLPNPNRAEDSAVGQVLWKISFWLCVGLVAISLFFAVVGR